MTVNTTNRKTSFTGNGTTGPYTYDFKIQQVSDLEVYLAGVKQLSGWTATPNANLVGGSINFSSVVTSGVAGLIARALDQTQETSIPAEANMPETTLESMHDKSMMVAQELQEQVDRSLKLPITTSVDTEFGDPTSDGQVLAYNETDDQLEWTSVAALYSEGGVGTGNVTGPSSSTDSNLAAFDGTTGRLLKDSGITVPATAGKALFPVRVNSGASGLEYHDQSPSELTIASGAIVPTGNWHTVDTESNASADDLTDITATSLPAGAVLYLTAADSGRVPTVKHNASKIDLWDDTDVDLAVDNVLILVHTGSNVWRQIGLISNGGASSGITLIGSPLASISANTKYTQAHGLGYTPSDAVLVVTCTSTDLGWAVGTRFTINGIAALTSTGYAVTLMADATNLILRTATYLPLAVTEASASLEPITGNKWSWQFGVRGSN